MQKVLSPADYDGKEDQYMDSLVCSMIWNGSEIKSNLVQAIFLSMSICFDGRLQDYHLHFSQVCFCYLVNQSYLHFDVCISNDLKYLFVCISNDLRYSWDVSNWLYPLFFALPI